MMENTNQVQQGASKASPPACNDVLGEYIIIQLLLLFLFVYFLHHHLYLHLHVLIFIFVEKEW